MATEAATARLPLKVVPGSSRDGVAGWLGETLKVRVAAPPEKGKANAAVERVVAEALGVPREQVRVVAGAASPRKVIAISGLTVQQVHERLAKAGA